mgnify:CR=1 FL=1
MIVAGPVYPELVNATVIESSGLFQEEKRTEASEGGAYDSMRPFRNVAIEVLSHFNKIMTLTRKRGDLAASQIDDTYSTWSPSIVLR